jgi:hypothetical protein
MKQKMLEERNTSEDDDDTNASASSEKGRINDNITNKVDKAVLNMTRAIEFCKQSKFRQAKPLFEEAFQSFLEEFGEDHQNTKAAYQNMQIANFKLLDELWMEVVREEMSKLDLEKDKVSSGTDEYYE